jgi:hypothetical protein
MLAGTTQNDRQHCNPILQLKCAAARALAVTEHRGGMAMSCGSRETEGA